MITAEDRERIAQRVVELLRQEKPAPLQELSVTTANACKMLGCPSHRTFHNEAIALGLRPYRRGKYLIRDVQNAVVKKSLKAQQGRAA